MALPNGCQCCRCTKQLFGRKMLFPLLLLKERPELIDVKRIRLWAVEMYVFALTVSVTNPSCKQAASIG